MKIKFITLNIEHGGILFDNIIDFLRDENPDIVVMQEIFNSEKEPYERRFRSFTELGKPFLKERPHHSFQGAFFDVTEVQDGATRGNAVYSRFNLHKNEKIEIGKPYGVVDEKGMTTFFDIPMILQHVEAELGNGLKLNIFNLHGIWGTDGKDNEERRRMANNIKDLMTGHNPMILAGDTNFTKEAVETIRIIESGGVKSVFDSELISSFNMKHKKKIGYATSVVDRVFVSPDINVVEKRMPKVDVSDHYPLVVEIEV